jgi:hypothetical protein
MPKIAQESNSTNTSVSIGAYQELMLKALCWQLAHLPGAWHVWLTLDREGKNMLREEGLEREDIVLAIDAGVRRGLILRRVIAGCPAIALKRLVQP